MIGPWRVHEEQGTSFFCGCQPRGTNSGTETGTETETGKIQEQVWCVHPQWTNHLPLPSPSLIGPRPCPRRPTAFRFFADDHQPRLAERYSPPTPPPLSRLPSYGPSIGRHGARVCFPRIHTDPCHLTDGKKEGEEGRKKKGRTRHLDLEWTAGHPPILTSPAWTTRKTSHTSMSPRWTSSGPIIATEGGWECKVRAPPSPFTESVRPSGSPLFPSQHTSATSPTGTGTGTGTWTSPSSSPLGPLFVMSWSRKPQPPACLCL